MTPDQARGIINNFCAEYCEGQTHYTVNGKVVSAADLTDEEALKAAEGVKTLMRDFAIEEAKMATIQ